jgi:hypothetical protein
MGNEQGKEPYYLDAKKVNPMKSSMNKNTFQDYEQGLQYNASVSSYTSYTSYDRAARAAIMIFIILILIILLASLLMRSRKKKNI